MIIYYDGECELCHRSVRFLKKADKKKKFQYVPMPSKQSDTLIFWDGKKEYRYGKGALRICWHLGGFWRLLGLFSFLPTFLADALYRLIAKNRHLF